LAQAPDSALVDTQAQTPLAFPDNFLLIDLCGEFDSNLATLEDRLDVQIVRRGNELIVMGDADVHTA